MFAVEGKVLAACLVGRDWGLHEALVCQERGGGGGGG